MYDNISSILNLYLSCDTRTRARARTHARTHTRLAHYEISSKKSEGGKLIMEHQKCTAM